ncbi:MAG: DUF1289 domain-containing protein [Bacteroidetes bacterium]|nr:MAG: DUF1289 domain-containing protein [Bacteroidota bacterium]
MAQLIKNPCRQICKYDETQVCTGCQRTMEETREWKHYPEKEKAKILRKASERENTIDIHTDHLDYYV